MISLEITTHTGDKFRIGFAGTYPNAIECYLGKEMMIRTFRDRNIRHERVIDVVEVDRLENNAERATK